MSQFYGHVSCLMFYIYAAYIDTIWTNCNAQISVFYKSFKNTKKMNKSKNKNNNKANQHWLQIRNSLQLFYWISSQDFHHIPVATCCVSITSDPHHTSFCCLKRFYENFTSVTKIQIYCKEKLN